MKCLLATPSVTGSGYDELEHWAATGEWPEWPEWPDEPNPDIVLSDELAPVKIKEFIDERLDAMLSHPLNWGGPKAFELQVLLLLELRQFLRAPLAPSQSLRKHLDAYSAFVRARRPELGSQPLSEVIDDAVEIARFLKAFRASLGDADHSTNYLTLLSKLLRERKAAGGKLPQAEEARFASELDDIWRKLTPEEQDQISSDNSQRNGLSCDMFIR